MHSVCDDFTIFKQLFPYDMTCCFQDVVIDVIDVNSGLSPMIYIRNQMVYPWNEEIISLAIFNFGKKKKQNKKTNMLAVTLKGGSEAVYPACQTRNRGVPGWLELATQAGFVLGCPLFKLHPF